MKITLRTTLWAVLLLVLFTGTRHPASALAEISLPQNTLTASLLRPQGTSPDPFWSNDFFLSGTNGDVYAIAVRGEEVYIGGSFQTVGPLAANFIARWDGNGWDTLANGANGDIFALAADSQGNLYAAGYFTDIGDTGIPGIARWDGIAWNTVGNAAPDGVVSALAVDLQGNLFAGGSFHKIGGIKADGIARWDGNAWYPLESGYNAENYQRLDALVADSRGHLYGAGWFSPASGGSTGGIVCWDTTTWQPVTSWLVDGGISALALDSQDNLYAGGWFATIGGVNADRIARWDGNNWYAVSTGTTDGSIQSLATDPQGNLYATGWFTRIGGVSASRIARWDGSTWQPLGRGSDRPIWTLATDSQGSLYAGGAFFTIGEVNASHIARWSGNTWNPLADPAHPGQGMNGPILALVKDTQGRIYAGGEFTGAGEIVANYIAMWDGTSWHSLGSGANHYVRALALDAQGNLYAGGLFTEIGGVAASRVARWDGSTWHPLGSGIALYGDVKALAVDAQGNLYAGGSFTGAGGVSTDNIARWDGSEWHPLGNGASGYVYALTVDGQGNLYAGGVFSWMDGVNSRGIARWDGNVWHALDIGIDGGGVDTLLLDAQGDLYIGGWFTAVGGVQARHIARWDGNSWHGLGDEVSADGAVRALLQDDLGNLYAGGDFTCLGGVNASHLARWDGRAWEALGNGISADTYALVFNPQGNLYAGGRFSHAGGQISSHIAFLQPPASLRGRAWHDQNANGLRDAGEPPARGVAVQVYDSTNVLTATAVTRANGSYNPVELWPGSYTLEFIPPYGYGLTLPDQGGDDTLDSDPDPLSGRTVPLSLTLGQAVSGWDAGLIILPFPVTVAITGTATGTVTSTPPGIACPPTCSYDFPFASPLSLRAIPAPGAVFTQWSDDAVGFSPSVTITIGGPQFITATFQPPITQTQLTLSPTLLSANGLDTATLIFTATSPTGSGPLAGRPILFSLTNQRGELADSAVSLDASGVATTTFTAGLIPGDETLFATFYENGIPIPVTSTLSLAPNPLTGRLAAGQHADLITYTFTLTNAAAFSQTVALSGSLPLHASLLTVSGAAFSPTGGDFGAGYVYTDGIPLAPGERAVISWRIEALQAGDFSTLAHATGPQARLQVPVQSNVYRLFLPCVRLK